MTTTIERTTMPVTGGINGYPVPEIGTAHILRDVSDTGTGNEAVHVIHWRDGWSVCEDKGELSGDPKEWATKSISEDWDEVITAEQWDAEEWINEEDYDPDNPQDAELLTRRRDMAEEIADALACSDAVVIDHVSGMCDAYDLATVYVNDTHHYALAFVR